MSNAAIVTEMRESMKGRYSPFPLRPASVVSVENELAEQVETLSRTGSICSNQSPGHHHHDGPCDACERGKKEVCSPLLCHKFIGRSHLVNVSTWSTN